MNILLLYYDSLPVGRAALQQGDGFVRRCYYNFEVLCGLRPFYIRYPTDVDEPQLRVSPIGCIAVVAHLVVFISSLVVAILHRKFVDTDNDLQLIDMGSFTLDLLLTINTFNIFVLVRNIKKKSEISIQIYFPPGFHPPPANAANSPH